MPDNHKSSPELRYSKGMNELSLPNLYFERVLAYLGEVYPHLRRPDPTLPLSVVSQGSAAVVVEVVPWETNSIKIAIWTYVVTDAEVNPALMKFLLRQNELLRFGGVSLDSEGDIRLHASIYGAEFRRQTTTTMRLSLVGVANALSTMLLKLLCHCLVDAVTHS